MEQVYAIGIVWALMTVVELSARRKRVRRRP